MKISVTVQDVCQAKLKNQLYGLLCEYEKGRDWEAFLDSIIIELLGYPEEEKTASYYTLFHKVSSLRYLSYKYFRTTIFDCMNLISKEHGNE
jgi:hypothetical protein